MVSLPIQMSPLITKAVLTRYAPTFLICWLHMTVPQQSCSTIISTNKKAKGWFLKCETVRSCYRGPKNWDLLGIPYIITLRGAKRHYDLASPIAIANSRRWRDEAIEIQPLPYFICNRSIVHMQFSKQYHSPLWSCTTHHWIELINTVPTIAVQPFSWPLLKLTDILSNVPLHLLEEQGKYLGVASII